MPEFTLPEIHLPDIKLPEGLRDMNRHDIQSAISDRMPRKVEMPDVDLSKIDLSKIDLPKAIEDRLSKVEKAINKIDLPKAVESRMPGRKRSNPILPIAAIVAVGSMFAAAWWLITSPGASIKVRDAADRIKARITGPETGLQRYDDDADLGSLLPEPDEAHLAVDNETWPDAFAEVGETVNAGNGSSGAPH